MKKLVEVNSESHLENLLGKTVTFICCRYFYSGELVSIDDSSVCIKNAGIIYETGELSDAKWKDRQALPGEFYISRDAIEGFGVVK